jgi:hypothetical protein
MLIPLHLLEQRSVPVAALLMAARTTSLNQATCLGPDASFARKCADRHQDNGPRNNRNGEAPGASPSGKRNTDYHRHQQ